LQEALKLFTGIIEGSGIIKKIDSKSKGAVVTIETDFDLVGTKIGDSIAVNGACLTAVSLQKTLFKVDVAPETIERTTFKKASAGTKVNIERALKFSDRLDGHLVSGHIDGTGVIASKIKKSNAWVITVSVPQILADQMIEKGSVAIDGISLTINRCSNKDFEISVIPHTAKMTTIEKKSVGDEVNIETDMLGKYVEKFLKKSLGTKDTDNADGHKDISLGLLAKNGFL
jgi:riboflavin synthase